MSGATAVFHAQGGRATQRSRYFVKIGGGWFFRQENDEVISTLNIEVAHPFDNPGDAEQVAQTVGGEVYEEITTVSLKRLPPTVRA